MVLLFVLVLRPARNAQSPMRMMGAETINNASKYFSMIRADMKIAFSLKHTTGTKIIHHSKQFRRFSPDPQFLSIAKQQIIGKANHFYRCREWNFDSADDVMETNIPHDIRQAVCTIIL